MSQGIIYCLSNLSHQDIFKIGFTRTTLKQRLQSLYSTGVVCPFKVEFAKKVFNCNVCELLLHKILSKYRVNKRREFFKLELLKIKELFDHLEGEYINVNNDKMNISAQEEADKNDDDDENDVEEEDDNNDDDDENDAEEEDDNNNDDEEIDENDAEEEDDNNDDLNMFHYDGEQMTFKITGNKKVDDKTLGIDFIRHSVMIEELNNEQFSREERIKLYALLNDSPICKLEWVIENRLDEYNNIVSLKNRK